MGHIIIFAACDNSFIVIRGIHLRADQEFNYIPKPRKPQNTHTLGSTTYCTAVGNCQQLACRGRNHFKRTQRQGLIDCSGMKIAKTRAAVRIPSIEVNQCALDGATPSVHRSAKDGCLAVAGEILVESSLLELLAEGLLMRNMSRWSI